MQKKMVCSKLAFVSSILIVALALSPDKEGRSQNSDSLRTIWSDLSYADTIRIKAICLVAWNYVYTHPDSSAYLADEAYMLALKSKNKKWQYNALYITGASYWARGNYHEALNYYNKSLLLVKELGDKKGESNTLNNIGVLYQSQGDYLNAIDYFLKCLAIFEELKDTTGQASAYNNIGLI
jgi:tetratricopeptide (TPR) repeat protein